MIRSILMSLQSGMMTCLMAGSFVLLMSSGVFASDSWRDLKNEIYKDQMIQLAKDEIVLEVPYRATDDRRVPVDVKVKLPFDLAIKKVTVIIDENPMPVSAVFDISKPKNVLNFSTFMRFNGPSAIRAIVEASDGKIYMSEKFVKTSGLGACAAPPIGDPAELMANLGAMELNDVGAEQTSQSTKIKRRAHLKIQHPNLTGLQMDQITLHYILARFVDTVVISQGDQQLFTLTASISLSQNPELTFDYQINEGNELNVHVKDTDDAAFQKTFPIGLGS